MDADRDRERRQAIEAADVALEHLHRAEEYLHSAGNWGAFDIFAGGFLSSMVKRGKMSRAQDELESARDALADFVRELRDVEGAGGWGIETGGFVGAADVFLDNPFVDLYVQGQIDDARYRVNRAIRQVEAIRARPSPGRPGACRPDPAGPLRPSRRESPSWRPAARPGSR